MIQLSVRRAPRVIWSASVLAAIAVASTTVLLHPIVVAAVLGAGALVGFIGVRPQIGMWLLTVLTPIETIGPLTFTVTKAAKLALVCAVIAAVMLGSKGSQTAAREKRNSYTWVLALLLISGTVATALSGSPLTSSMGLFALGVFVMYYAAIGKCRFGENAPQFLRLLIWMAIPVSILCFIQLTQGYGGMFASKEQLLTEAEGEVSTVWPWLERGSAFFNGPSACGAFLGIATVVASLHAITLKKARAWYWAAALTCFLGVLATFSRGAILGVFAGLMFAAAGLGLLTRRRTLAVVIGGALLFVALWALPETAQYLRLGEEISAASPSRVDAWQAASVMVERRPLFGIGFYQFRELSQGVAGVTDTAQHPHNGLLKAAVEEGILGACAYVAFLLLFVRTSWRSLRMEAPAETRWVLAALAGAGVALFTQELFDANLTSGGSSIALLFAAMLAMQASIAGKMFTRQQAISS